MALKLFDTLGATDAAREPEHGAVVRESNRRVFEGAIDCYRELYRVPRGVP